MRRIIHQWEYSHARTRGRGSELFPSAQGIHHLPPTELLDSALMSHSQPTTSLSNSQIIINDALRAYQRRTKKDLLSHPLASQLQVCNSPGAILAILQQQVQGQDQSRSSDDRWTKWLDPTVEILYALSETLGEDVGLVSLATGMNLYEICILIYIWQIFSSAKAVFTGVGVLLLVRIFIIISTRPT